MKITFEVSPKLTTSLKKLLSSVEIPATESEIAALALQELESLGDGECDNDSVLATTHVYPNRETALRVALRLNEKYAGDEAQTISYRKGLKIVTESFPNHVGAEIREQIESRGRLRLNVMITPEQSTLLDQVAHAVCASRKDVIHAAAMAFLDDRDRSVEDLNAALLAFTTECRIPRIDVTELALRSYGVTAA